MNETHLRTAQDPLRAAQRVLTDEVSSYPTPISGCDAQFNRRLSDRARIAAARDALAHSPFIPTPRMLTPAKYMESR